MQQDKKGNKATKATATKVTASEVKATEVKATEVSTTEVTAEEVKVTEVNDVTTARADAPAITARQETAAEAAAANEVKATEVSTTAEIDAAAEAMAALTAVQADTAAATAAATEVLPSDSSVPDSSVPDKNAPGSSASTPAKNKAAPKTFIYHNEKLLLPKYDLIFKAIFGSERSKSVLAAFLTDVLALPPLAPKELTIMNNELIPLNHQNKDCRLDVRVRIRETAHVNIEIQLSNEYNILDRSVYYTADVLSRQLLPADDYAEVPPAIGLYILDFRQFDDNRLFRFGSIYDEETGELISKKLRIAFLELPKLKTLDSTQTDEPRVQWARFIAADNQEVLDKLTYTNKNIEEAVSILREASADPKLLYDYEMRIKGENDRIAALATAKKRGEEIGEKRGEKRGKKIGEKIGEERGRKEEKLEIARTMLESGLDLATICKFTGLNEQEIQEIAKQQKE